MATYSNISGTTKKSFKFGPNGVTLSTKAITTDSGTIKKLITDQVIDDRYYQLAYEDPNDPIYAKFDGFIASENISKLQNTQNGLRIYLKKPSDDGQTTPDYIDITTNITAVSGPENAIDGDIVLFDGNTGKAIKDSNFKINQSTNLKDYITYDSNNNPVINKAAENTVATTTSILSYIGVLDKGLADRLEGKL